MSAGGELQARLSGTALVPGDAGFAAALEIDNGRIDLVPTYVVQPRSAEDVALALQFVGNRSLPLTVKC